MVPHIYCFSYPEAGILLIGICAREWGICWKPEESSGLGLGLEMGQSCQVPADCGSEHSGMSLPPLNGTRLASLVPASLPWAWDPAPAGASHVRKEPGAGREFYSCWRGKGRCSGNAGDVKWSQVSSGAALISSLGSGDGDDSGFFMQVQAP